ncbi:MAG: sulfatase-like hydrolase/transferase, partial [Planctomycetales bacterium]|nr:sulfatase-like hydrolase/transferase [Planctomycetales bacterium]
MKTHSLIYALGVALALVVCAGATAHAQQQGAATAPKSLVDAFADLAQLSNQPPVDVPDEALPAQAQPRQEREDDDGDDRDDPLEVQDFPIVDFFGSDAWAEIKARNLRNLRLANRKSRVKECEKTNVILILINDLGYGDLGAYGQKRIKTPNIDRLANTGVRFTQYYAGSSVDIPSYCSLMTGMHTGHCRLRGSGDGRSL